MTRVSERAAIMREPYDFDEVRPISELAEMCLDGEHSFDDASGMFARALIIAAVAHCRGNQSEAARQIGINRTSLCEYLNRMGAAPHQIAARKRSAEHTRAMSIRAAHQALADYTREVLSEDFAHQFPKEELQRTVCRTPKQRPE